MQCVCEFEGLDVTPLQRVLAKESDAQWQPSELYSAESETKFVDTELRLSEFRLLKSAAAFEAAENIVQQLRERWRAGSDSCRDEERAGDGEEGEQPSGGVALQSTDTPSHGWLELVRNDVTHIRYHAGGFFKAHRDFLSLTSNFVQEYTLIVCVGDCCDVAGGETVVHVNPATSIKSRATVTCGGALLFRKDLEHEGTAVLQGTKEIVTLNIWWTKHADDQGLLHVVFPGSADDTHNEDDKVNGEDGSPCAVDGESESDARRVSSSVSEQGGYVMRVSDVLQHPLTLLAGYLRWARNTGEDGPKESRLPVYRYECTSATYEEFRVVYLVVTGQYVPMQMLRDNVEVLKYFNYPLESILVDVGAGFKVSDLRWREVVDLLADGSSTELTEEQRRHLRVPQLISLEDEESYRCAIISDDTLEEWQRIPEEVQETKRRKIRSEIAQLRALEESALRAEESDSLQSIILCSSIDRTMLMSRLAKDLGLPYVPFKIMFVEGEFRFDGDAAYGNPGTEWGMRPAFVCVGDYDNVLFLRSCVSFHPPCPTMHSDSSRSFLDAVQSKCDGAIREKFTTPGTRLHFPKRYDAMEMETHELCETAGGAGGAVRVATDCLYGSDYVDLIFAPSLSIESNGTTTMSDVLGVLTNIEEGRYCPTATVLPGGDDVKTKVNEFYHLDSSGRACFTHTEAEATSERLRSMQFVDRVRVRLPKFPFELAQQVKTDVNHHFCNETIYGTLTLLAISGLVLLQEDASA